MKLFLASLAGGLSLLASAPASAQFSVTGIDRNPTTGEISLTWTTVPGRYYNVLKADSPVGPWLRTEVIDVLADAPSANRTLADPGTTSKFYRVAETESAIGFPQIPFATVAIYDEDVIQTNTVDKNAYVDDFLTMTKAGFQSLVTSAYPLGNAGIVDFENFDDASPVPDGYTIAAQAPAGIGDNFQLKLGDPAGTGPMLTVTMGDQNGPGTDGWTIRDRVVSPEGRTPISGTKCLGGSANWDFNFDPADRVTHVGFTLLSRTGTGFPTDADIEVYFGDDYSEYMDYSQIDDLNGGDDTFFGIQSEFPEDTFITRIVIKWADGVERHTSIDDFGFIVNPGDS